MRLVTKIMVAAACVTTIAVGVKAKKDRGWIEQTPRFDFVSSKGTCADVGVPLSTTPCAKPDPDEDEWLPYACTYKFGVWKVQFMDPEEGEGLIGPSNVTNDVYICNPNPPSP